MDWSDRGIVLHVRRHGESSVILELLTREHGRHLGLVRGGGSRRLRGALQAGNTMRATWRARLSEHLGTFTVEPETERTGVMLSDRLALAGLTAATSVASAALPEREAHSRVFDGLCVVLDSLADASSWPAVLVRWELGLLQDLGFGLDLAACALTGETEGLAYVSPRTGRAVTAAGAGIYAHRLLPLPAFLAGGTRAPSETDVTHGLRLTQHFLEKRVFAPQNKAIPAPRADLVERLWGERMPAPAKP